jgi:hypothetical protein
LLSAGTYRQHETIRGRKLAECRGNADPVNGTTSKIEA